MQEAPPTQFYTWKNYRCSYSIHQPTPSTEKEIPLLLVHPIGVGLSRHFWQRFCNQWEQIGCRNPIYNPDLLGCGECDLPRVAYTSQTWAEQLQYFLQTVVKKPVILVVHGASFPIAIALLQQIQSNWVQGLVLSGPPSWGLITSKTPEWKQRLSWNLFFDSPIGTAFYRYARREQFLQSFSTKRLFATPQAVDGEWLETLKQGAENLDSRYAVFSFLAGFWRENYQEAIASISQPTLVVMGSEASNIGRAGKGETPEQRLANYLKCLPNGQGVTISGRNVLPYESAAEFVATTAQFVNNLTI
jgi:pimeloyl-ACP methyl ester carboxylesterase